jgi:prevent-host-death family protein
VRTMAAGTFKNRCLQVMDEVHARREEIVITKHGKPVAKLVPVDAEPEDLFNFLRDKITIVGDVVGPVIPVEEWESLR